MLQVTVRRVAEGEVERHRWWMGELMRRREEVIATFENEGTSHEVAELMETLDGPMLIHAMEVADPQRVRVAFQSSSLPIDAQHKEVMEQVLGDPVPTERLLDVAMSS